MWYGFRDILRDTASLRSKSDRLRRKEFWAVDDISFEIRKGETLGLIGPNGAGKTTLLKMLNGIIIPDKGSLRIKGRVGALIQIGAGFHPQLTGRENIYINGAILGMGKREIDRKFDAIVEFANIGDFLDTPVKFYSSGMFVRLGFAVAVHCEPDILLVDEVLAVGDYGFQNKCFNRIGELRNNGTTTVVISHNMHLISVFTQRVLLLRKGIVDYNGDVAQGIEKYNSLFINGQVGDIEKICSGNDEISFTDIKTNKRLFYPKESFEAEFIYTSRIDYNDVDVDIRIASANEPMSYFQATNKAYGKKVNLKKGKHVFKIRIHDIKINHSIATVVVSIFSHNREETLVWWRIPVEFKGVKYSTGRNFLDVSYEVN